MPLHIEFDHQQVTIGSQSADVIDRVYAVFEHALVASAENRIGKIDVTRDEGVYSVTTAGHRLVSRTLDALTVDLKWLVHRLFMNARPELLWLHAGAVERGVGTLLLCGMAGQGKSTIATLLVADGWRLLSDDIAPVQPDASVVLPYFELPVRRLGSILVMPRDRIESLRSEEIRVASEQLQRKPSPIRILVFIRIDADSSVQLEKLDPARAVLELLRNTANFGRRHDEPLDADNNEIFLRAVTVASHVPAYVLTYSSSCEAANVLDHLYSSVTTAECLH